MTYFYSFLRYTLLLLSCLCLLPKAKAGSQPEVIKGVLDLRQWNFEQNGIVNLDGEWQFYYNNFLTIKQLDSLPNPTYLKVPSASWEQIGTWEGQAITGHGFASYRLRILLPPNSSILALKTLDQSSAWELSINGEKPIKFGKIGKTAQEVQAYPSSSLVYFQTKNDTLDILVHISNFHHRKGGLWESFWLGNYKDIQQMRENALSMTLFLCGSLILMGFYHLFLFGIRKKENSALTFALLCFAVPIRIICTNEAYIVTLLPTISWDLKFKVEYISLFLLSPLVYSFLVSVFPLDFSRPFLRVYSTIIGFFVVIVVLTDSNFYTHLLIPYQILMLILISTASYGLFRSVWHKREGAYVFALGSLVLILTSVNDILHSSLIINTFYIIPWGFFVFFFSQAALLSMRFSNAFLQVANLSEELKSYNENLETLVDQRTEALKSVNQELHQTIGIIHHQKEDIEHKNKEITASITYAKRIQTAILSRMGEINEERIESFVLFKPKDIVSGDFYWFGKKNDESGNKVVVAASDCTGHGVPGAFMSMIGNSLLNQIVRDRGIYEPDLILSEMHQGIIYLLNQSQSQNRDSIHISIVVIDLLEAKMEFAGAKHSIIYFQEGKSWEIKGDKNPIGDTFGIKLSTRSFQKHEIALPSLNGNLENKTTFYLFSDGYIDQFGGKEKRRFSKNRLFQLFQDIYLQPISQQALVLEEKLQEWITAGNSKQIDDILVLGIRV